MKNKLTLEDIQSVIVKAEYHRLTDKLTTCVLTLQNGYTVTGESACIDATNYVQEIGEKIAYENAMNKVWQLEGYLLQQKIFEARQGGTMT
ncbi:Gp49 family protein [Glaesserella sp.]|uniref:Gp49 family protein n=1 Tax=Glaesserella sp. TaxID=2094731 RepID=UPI0035A0D7DA